MHLSLLIYCILLQVGGFSEVGNNPTPRLTDRLPVIPPLSTPAAPTGAESSVQPPAPFSATAVPPATMVSPPLPSPNQSSPNQLHHSNGILILPRRSHVTLAAVERALLTSLKTEQRDAAGNIQRDEMGEPIMIPIEEGMYVSAGQLLAQLDDHELASILEINQAQLAVAQAEKEKTIEIVVAAEGVRVAMQDLAMMEEANRRQPGIFPLAEVRRAELGVAQARAQLGLQKYTLEEIKTREVLVRESELERTRGQKERRQLFATIDGMVVKLHAAEGEWLREGDPILEIMQLDTIWVRASVNAKNYEISDVDGKQATVQVALANGKMETFQGKVVFCPPEIEAGNTFVMYVEVQNRRIGNFWLLQPGRTGVGITIAL